jgi:hypothetical protein
MTRKATFSAEGMINRSVTYFTALHCIAPCRDGSWAMTREGRWDHFPKSGDQSDIEGESFYFKVNGVPIYMKGANLVPLHILPTNVSKAAIHDLMKYALQSNMNMIRIWGGGMYPVSSSTNSQSSSSTSSTKLSCQWLPV